MELLEQVDIRTVAIYIRKSRDEEGVEDVLEKHRTELVSLAKEKGWAYTLYEEVGSGERIATRPRMLELLDDIELRMFDAVLAVHQDRLSRGDESDQAHIKRIFARSETLFATPERIYDFNNDNDILTADFQGMMARLELRTIKRRFRQGKVRNAKVGKWSMGKPPFPYIRNEQTGKAEPDRDAVPIYRYMVDKALEGYSTTDIAWDLNKQGVPSPRGGTWAPAVVRRLLCDEVHLGRVVFGKKQKTNYGDIVYKPKETWHVIENAHEAVKTEREHEKLLFLISEQRKTPHRAREGRHQLSGLIRCGQCGATLQIQKRTSRPSDALKSCSYRDNWGNRCGNLGGRTVDIETEIYNAILNKEAELVKAIEEGVQKKDLRFYLKMREEQHAIIRKKEKQLANIRTAWETEEYTTEVYHERRDVVSAELQAAEEEYVRLARLIDTTENAKNDDMLASVRETIAKIKAGGEPKDLNRAYKSIIHTIEWTRADLQDRGALTVNFL